MNDRNYTISARIDAREFISVAHDLRQRGVSFGSIADVVAIVLREYCDTHEITPLTMEQTLLLMTSMGLSTKRVHVFKPGRSGLGGLDQVARAAIKALEAEPPNLSLMDFDAIRAEVEEEEEEI